MDQSNIQEIKPEDTTIQSNSIASFASSWAAYWTVLSEDTRPNGSKHAAFVPPGGLSDRAKLRIAVGCVVAGIFIITAAVSSRKKRLQSTELPRWHRNKRESSIKSRIRQLCGLRSGVEKAPLGEKPTSYWQHPVSQTGTATGSTRGAYSRNSRAAGLL
jgi:hypothetical protein